MVMATFYFECVFLYRHESNFMISWQKLKNEKGMNQ
jgi:hypothetical protein